MRKLSTQPGPTTVPNGFKSLLPHDENGPNLPRNFREVGAVRLEPDSSPHTCSRDPRVEPDGDGIEVVIEQVGIPSGCYSGTGLLPGTRTPRSRCLPTCCSDSR